MRNIGAKIVVLGGCSSPSANIRLKKSHQFESLSGALSLA
jgi:hypothetical protein